MEDGSGIRLHAHLARDMNLLLPWGLLLGTTDLPIAVQRVAEVVAAEIFLQYTLVSHEELNIGEMGRGDCDRFWDDGGSVRYVHSADSVSRVS